MKGLTARHPGTTPVELMTTLRRDFSIAISYYRSWKGKEVVQEQIDGSRKDSYNFLPSYVLRLSGVDPDLEHAWSANWTSIFEVFLGVRALYT